MLVETLASALGIHLLQRHSNLASASRSLPAARGALDPGRLDRVRDFIETNLGEDLTIEALANEACLSPFHFARAFKAATGVAPPPLPHEPAARESPVLDLRRDSSRSPRSPSGAGSPRRPRSPSGSSGSSAPPRASTGRAIPEEGTAGLQTGTRGAPRRACRDPTHARWRVRLGTPAAPSWLLANPRNCIFASTFPQHPPEREKTGRNCVQGSRGGRRVLRRIPQDSRCPNPRRPPPPNPHRSEPGHQRRRRHPARTPPPRNPPRKAPSSTPCSTQVSRREWPILRKSGCTP